MTPERWAEIVSVFEQASDLPANERAQFLDGACSEPSMRREVDTLLAHAADDPADLDPLIASAARSVVDEDLTGTRVGDFRVDALLGRGGMGVVYRTVDERLNRPVALKVLPGDVASNPERRARFLREARAAATVNHPNIATIYDVGEANERAFIAMEYVDGRTLRERITDGAIARDEAISIARQILAALSRAHDAGVIHRDLKPDNVMLASDGTVKVLDFGLASEPAKRDDGEIRGTPSYMSPEQARGNEVDQRSDIFAFGIVLYEMLAGARPFTGATPSDVLAAIQTGSPARANLPPDLAAVIDRCLAKSRSERFASCRDVMVALERKRAWWKIAAAASVLAFAAAVAIIAMRPDARRGGAITDVPPPESQSAEAQAAYAAALQAFRDSSWGAARGELQRAVAADPALAAAHLRLAVANLELVALPSEVMPSYSQAVRLRARLSERDREILHALEPALAKAPPDRVAAAARLTAIAKQRAGDAEVHWLIAVIAPHDRELQLHSARRAASIDPAFADAWYVMTDALAARGELDEAMNALSRCERISPTATDCIGSRGRILGKLGRCEEMEAALARAIDANPSDAPQWLLLRAIAMHAAGKPRETVLEALRPRWSNAPPAERDTLRDTDTAKLAIAYGDFMHAEVLLAAARDRLADTRDSRPHLRIAAMQIDIALETGRIAKAAQVASEFLARSEVWLEVDPRDDPTPWMLRTMHAAGAITHDELDRRRAEWIARTRDRYIGEASAYPWLLTNLGIEDRDEATGALAQLPAREPALQRDRIWDLAQYGSIALAAGRIDDALPHLERLAKSCVELEDPATFWRLVARWAAALEAKGQIPEACAAYGRIVARWGTAQSTTAANARTRMTALNCR